MTILEKKNVLLPPVTYQGGKQRIAKDIVNIIYDRNKDSILSGEIAFYDLCCGSGAVTLETLNRDIPFKKFFMCDISVWGDFWKSIGEGTFVTELFDIYLKNIPEDKEEIQGYLKSISKQSPYDGVNLSEVYRFLILQAGSFGGKPIWIENGKWASSSYRSFWKPTETSNRRSHVNPMMPMPETLLERIQFLTHELTYRVEHTKQRSILEIKEFEENSIVYIDPPYADTAKYGDAFDVVEWVKEVKKNNPKVVFYVSEKKPIGDSSFKISEPRKKGNISGNGRMTSEWLTEIR